jgi:hypothetical protein
MWKGKTLGRYYNMFLVYLIKGRDFNFVIHFNRLLWLKVWMDEWMGGWMDVKGKTRGSSSNTGEVS